MRKEAVELALYQMECTLGLIRQCKKDWWDERDIPVLETAIEALKKQMPLKPIGIEKDTDDIGNCPSCDGIVYYHINVCYCKKCGQAIDWKEGEA